MRSPLFIDTGAFYAKYVARDAYHEESQTLWDKVRTEGWKCVTTNFVVSELISLLVYRFGISQALQAGREIYASHALEIFPSTLEIEIKALEWLERFSDQDFSMTDACSFALMSERQIKVVFSFDKHFEIAGFQKFR